MKLLKNKKGFTIIETIVVAVMLTTSLLMIYSSYSSSIINERIRLYYDDVAYIYKANNIKEYLLRTADLDVFVKYELEPTDDNEHGRMLVDISVGNPNLFQDDSFSDGLTMIEDNYNLVEFILLKPDYNIISKCSMSSNDFSDEKSRAYCSQFLGLSSGLRNYIKSLGSDIKISSALSEPYFLDDYKVPPASGETNYGEYMLIYVFGEDNQGNYCEILGSCKNKYVYLRSGVYYEK